MRPHHLLILLAAPLASAGSFEGTAPDPDSGKGLYPGTHYVWDANTPAESRIVLYRCAPGGPPFARKELRYDASRTAPSFELDDARSGHLEGLQRAGGAATVFARAGAKAPRRSAAVADPALIADAGFDEYVRSHWDALQRGDTLTAPFLVPSLLESVEFRVRKVAAARGADPQSSVIRLSVAGPLGWFLSDIDVSYRNADLRLVSYIGLTNIRDGRDKMITARIDFPDAARLDATPPAADLRALPLVKSCD